MEEKNMAERIHIIHGREGTPCACITGTGGIKNGAAHQAIGELFAGSSGCTQIRRLQDTIDEATVRIN